MINYDEKNILFQGGSNGLCAIDQKRKKVIA